jgi:thiol:disulfide interchange protein DsbA
MTFVPQQRLFYTLEAMGTGRQAACQGVCRDPCRAQALSAVTTIADWVAKQGVDKAKFAEQYNSFSVRPRPARRPSCRMPTGSRVCRHWVWRGASIPMATMAGWTCAGAAVVDYLIAEVRAGR